MNERVDERNLARVPRARPVHRAGVRCRPRLCGTGHSGTHRGVAPWGGGIFRRGDYPADFRDSQLVPPAAKGGAEGVAMILLLIAAGTAVALFS